MSYNPFVRLSRMFKRSTAALGGDQICFNGVPIRPMSLVGGTITYDVLVPFRVSLGVLPKGANVFGAVVAVKEVFNAGATNVLIVGTLADPDMLVEIADVNEAAVGTAVVCHRAGGVLAADTEFFATFTQTGAAATTGSADIGLMYSIP